MSCPSPLDAAVLADYWLGALDDREQEAVEQHLLGCDQCGDRLRELIALAEGVRALASGGALRMIVSDAFLQRASEQGARIREYAPPAGGSVQCTVHAEDDILVGRLAADLSRAHRVDLSICDERGVEQVRLADIPVRPGAGGVIYQESMAFLKAAPSLTMVARLVGADEHGGERLLGEYTFHHTRSIAGPGAW
jgi:Putative zinc-finger